MGLLQSLEWDNMDDTGMYVWSIVLTIGALAFSWGTMLVYQRWRNRRAQDAGESPRKEA